MPTPKISGYFSNSNYLQSNGCNENLNLIGGSVTAGNASFSAGAGYDVNCTIGEKGVTATPAIEAKVKYNIGENLNAQARFREIGGAEQYRVTFGGSYSFDKHNSIYTAVHTTLKDKHNGEPSINAGGWVGYTYKFDNGITLSAELQQNVPLSNPKPIGETLGSFNDGNKLFNVMLTVPLF